MNFPQTDAASAAADTAHQGFLRAGRALQESMESTTVALRKARARILGVDVEELVHIDNRVLLIASVAKEHSLSLDDARNYVDDMERQARFESSKDDRQREEDEANEVVSREIEQDARNDQ